MIEIYNNIFFLIFGSLIKIIDDHYDMNMFDEKFAKLGKGINHFIDNLLWSYKYRLFYCIFISFII